jgi:membrane protein insertase Oxa1/YidC/SpoIIIJ
MGSCGFLLIQMPFLIVIYNIIMNITSLSNEFYLYAFLPLFSITQIDYNFFGIDLLGSGGTTGILLGLSVAAIQYTQVRLSLAGRETAENKS